MTADPHLDPLELDALRAGEPASAGQRAHLAWCASCRSALADLHALAARLRAVPPPIPAERDAAILALAARAARRPGGERLARAGRWAAAALLLLAVGGLVALQRQQAARTELAAAPPRAPLAAAQADLDGDGRVTVLDAFALARAVTRGTPRLGEADRHDVDRILALAVAVDRPAEER